MKAKTFCNFCGKILDKDRFDGKERQLCRNCSEVYYENPLPVVSVILSNHNREILLVRREREPFKGMWCCPIGFAEVGESVEDAALRELEEESGVKGKIVQLIDVGSHANYIYGDLLVVTFEAEKIAGTERAGDDASEYRYFPIMNLPKLAFDSQEKAIKKYVELKKDIWKMHDSFESLAESAREDRIVYPGGLLSDELVRVVQSNSRTIIDLWVNDIKTNPSTPAYYTMPETELSGRAMVILGQFESWLKGIKEEKEFKDFYYTVGHLRKKENIPLEELISSLSLLKKHIWMFTYSFGVWDKPLDIYRMFELGERLVRFFDKAAYHTIVGYHQGA